MRPRLNADTSCRALDPCAERPSLQRERFAELALPWTSLLTLPRPHRAPSTHPRCPARTISRASHSRSGQTTPPCVALYPCSLPAPLAEPFSFHARRRSSPSASRPSTRRTTRYSLTMQAPRSVTATRECPSSSPSPVGRAMKSSPNWRRSSRIGCVEPISSRRRVSC